MEFEHDRAKSAKNKDKHGIDFEEARDVWNDIHAITAPVEKFGGESRFLVIGKIRGKIWTVVITYREERVRIISARRARKEEVTEYEE